MPLHRTCDGSLASLLFAALLSSCCAHSLLDSEADSCCLLQLRNDSAGALLAVSGSGPEEDGQPDPDAKPTAAGPLFDLSVLGLCIATAGFCALRGPPDAAAPELDVSSVESPVQKEALLAVAIFITAFQGGGLIFGFSAFAEQLIQWPKSPFTASNVSSIFAIGHNIAAFGGLASGALLDYAGPRWCAVLGLALEAAGLMLLSQALRLPRSVTMVAYGLVGLGGSQAFVASLTFTNAFARPALIGSVLTGAAQLGGVIFMVLPNVPWENFFIAYGVFCIAGAMVTSKFYPNAPLKGVANISNEKARSERRSLLQVLMAPGTIGFLATYMVTGGALIYGAGEFTSAMQVKDHCRWSKAEEEFLGCKMEGLQRHLSDVAMPLFGNIIFPAGMAVGMIIETYGFAAPAFISVFSTQAFIAGLWLLDLRFQYATVICYNVAISLLFTVQSAYICDVAGEEHVGSLYGISNLALGTMNLMSDWLDSNPLSEGRWQVPKSLGMSCIFWLVITCPLYAWAVIEGWHGKDAEERKRETMQSWFQEVND